MKTISIQLKNAYDTAALNNEVFAHQTNRPFS